MTSLFIIHKASCTRSSSFKTSTKQGWV